MTVTDAFENLRSHQIDDFESICSLLDDLEHRPLPVPPEDLPFLDRVANGIAFVTFAYDIDGVTMEVAKYGQVLDTMLREKGYEPSICCVGGNFHRRSGVVLSPDWQQIPLRNADGWDKWEEGKWFSRLFFEDMPEGSAASREMASTMWLKAVEIAEELAVLLAQHEIGLMIPVNVNSNPGNFALALAIVLVSEVTGCPVLNNNHDFYWDGGRPAAERGPDEPPGSRDHFFRNIGNRAFFDVFQRILPWNGRRWVQVNISPLQSTQLLQEGFDTDRVFLVGTAIEDEFFDLCSLGEKLEYRRRMAHILSDGKPTIAVTAVAEFQERMGTWMPNQRPIVCGLREGTELDLASTETLVLLQPTRVVARKRIPRDWELIHALLENPSFRKEFEQRANMALVLLVTGPVPIEHRRDAEAVLEAFVGALDSLPETVGARVFQAFSVGNQRHPSLSEGLEIFDIYHHADMVLFPSETEGRGLPIPEAGAAGIPIVCSRYEPVEVFDELVGTHRPKDERQQYLEFPAADFDDSLPEEIAAMLLDPASFASYARHNRDIVQARFSMHDLQCSFAEYLQRLEAVCEG